MEEYRRTAQYEKLAELQYAVLPKLEERLKKAEKAEAGDAPKPKLLRTPWVPRKSPKSSVAQRAFPSRR